MIHGTQEAHHIMDISVGGKIHHVLKRKKLYLKACSEQNEIVFAHAKRKNK